MLRAVFLTVSLFLLVALLCRADLTLRYTLDMNLGAAMDPIVSDIVKRQTAATTPKEQVIRIKGDRTLSGMGLLTGIMDNATGELTLLKPAAKQYARVSFADYGAAIQSATAISAAAKQAMEHMKLDVESSSTGQMAMVYGIRAEEHLTTLTVSTDLPNAAAPAGPVMRMETRTWLASPSDLDRIPGLRQYADYAQRTLSLLDSADAMQKLFSQFPGVGDKMRALTAEMTKNPGSLTVKMQETIYMPAMGQLMRARPQADSPKADPNAPFMEIHMDLAQISTDAIDDSVFDVPSDYQQVPVSEIIQAPKADGTRTTATAAPPAIRPPLDPGEQIYRVGGGVTAPVVVDKLDPEYSAEASRAKLSGTVLLAIVVDKQGDARDIRVMRGLGMGLDEKAIEAVSRWKFKPAQKDGQPVNVRANIEINFRLRTYPLQQ